MRMKITNERTKETGPRSHSSSADAMKACVGRNSGSSTSAPSFSSSALLSSSLSPPLPEFPLWRLALRVLFSRGRDPPPHVRGAKEV